MVTSIFYHCKAGSNISRNNSSNHVTTTVTDSSMRNKYDGSDYAVLIGGIIGGLLVICVLVAVFLLRRRKCMIKSNETNDSTHGQSVPDNNQDGQLMNSTHVAQVSASHSVNIYHTPESMTYSHLRSTVNDTDVMYDHTVRHNVHNTCDGDYGIAQRRTTEDDYDVSGNYRTSHSKETDPVYN
ncbi:Hypothetical predicted protein [Mytilus galloprovincialis]|uniref:Uncharacterized protein n=1 Tax=Mytilus galloprovincialis TaxID=29158 RepID=A0A8B6CJC1_MYTGA|nr:Hypothetical predicted protein [Mytilus galloprovincialis]